MEARIERIEKEMAIVSASLVSIGKSLEKISEVQMENKVLVEKVTHMDRELVASFGRVYDRIEKVEGDYKMMQSPDNSGGCNIGRINRMKLEDVETQVQQLQADRKKVILLAIASIFSGIAAFIFNGGH